MRREKLGAVSAIAAITALLGCEREPIEVDYASQQVAPPPAAQLPDRLPEVAVDDDGYVKLSGNVKSWATLQYVGDVQLTTLGIVPEDTGSSGADGTFELAAIQAASGAFWVKAYKPDYHYTYEYVRMTGGDYVGKTLYILKAQDLTDMATVYGKTPNPACGTVVAELKDATNAGVSNIDGVKLNGVTYEGPYFLGEDGKASAAQTYTSSNGRVVFFNVCSPGVTSVNPNTTAQLTIDEEGYVAPVATYLNIYAAGVTHGTLQVEENGVVPPPEPPPVVTEPIDFTTHIYPIITREGCAACHAPGGAAEGTGLYLDGTPEEMFDALLYNTYRVNLEYPQQSLVLVKPLYEEPPDHPNASFPSVDHPDYVTVLNWILQGAPYGDELIVEPPPPEPVFPANVNFFDNVQPRFAQRTCTGCHNAVSLSGGLDLTGKPVDVYNRLIAVGENRVVAGYHEQSYLYTKPNAYYIEQAHNGGKPIPNIDDPFAQYVGGWIYQGANFVQPPPMTATADLAPFFQARGCTGCHNQNDQANYNDLRLDLTGQQLVDELKGVYDGDNRVRVTAYDPENSPIMKRPWDNFPAQNHTGGKISLQTYYKEYHRIVTWIYEGATAP